MSENNGQSRLDIDVAWKFWEEILVKDGKLDMDQLKKELTDWYYVMGEAPKVYCAVTGNQLSKVMYAADTVIMAFEDYMQRELDEMEEAAVRNAKEEAYNDCIEVAKDFTGQGVQVLELLKKHKEKALARAEGL